MKVAFFLVSIKVGFQIPYRGHVLCSSKTELYCCMPYLEQGDMMFSDVDLEDLLSALAPSEIQSLVDEMASDPDDKHLPASVRNSYRCSKEPTGELNRDSLINHINQEGTH